MDIYSEQDGLKKYGNFLSSLAGTQINMLIPGPAEECRWLRQRAHESPSVAKMPVLRAILRAPDLAFELRIFIDAPAEVVLRLVWLLAMFT